MMNDNFKQNEEQLKRLLKGVHQDVDIPDGQKSWLQVKARLDRMSTRKRWLRRLVMGTLVVCTSLIISLILTADLSVAYSQFESLLKKVHENIIDIFNEEPESY